MTRPLLVFVPGPLHLFRTSGIYYLRELLRSYDVMLIGWTDYAGDPAFETARHWAGVRDVRLMPQQWERRRYHRAFADLARDLAKLPDWIVLLQHNDAYPHNLYLIAAAERRGVLRAVFVNGFSSDLALSRLQIQGEEVAALQRRLRAPRFLARAIFELRSQLRFAYQYVVLPLASIGRPLRSPLNVYTYRARLGRHAEATDLLLLYTEHERDAFRRSFGDSPAVVVRHPARITAEEVHRMLGMPSGGEAIAFLPTFGFVTAVADKRGGIEQAVAFMTEAWVKTLSVLRERLGPRPIVAKLHPGARDDVNMQEIMRRVAAEVPDFEMRDPQDSAERIALASHCVVSCTSTIQLWAWRIGGRIVISLDAWDVPGSDLCRDYPGIVCVRDPGELRDNDLTPVGESEENSGPTVTVALADALRRHRSQPAVLSAA
jgi:hypothetical protein